MNCEPNCRDGEWRLFAYCEEPGGDGRHERPTAEMVDVVAIGIELGTLDIFPRRVGGQVDGPAAVPLCI